MTILDDDGSMRKNFSFLSHFQIEGLHRAKYLLSCSLNPRRYRIRNESKAIGGVDAQ